MKNNNQALTVRAENENDGNGIKPADLRRSEMDIFRLGDVLAKSGFFASDSKLSIETQASQAIVKVLAGRELGLGDVASMTGIHIVKGKPVIGASLIAGKIQASGEYGFEVGEFSDEVCEIVFTRNGSKIGTSRFTIADAKTADLTTGANAHSWRKFPRNMLYARAISNGAKWYCPALFAGIPIYSGDELGGQTDEAGDLIAETIVVEPTKKVAEKREEVQTAKQALRVVKDPELSETALAMRAELEAELALVDIDPTASLDKFDRLKTDAERATALNKTKEYCAKEFKRISVEKIENCFNENKWKTREINSFLGKAGLALLDENETISKLLPSELSIIIDELESASMI